MSFRFTNMVWERDDLDPYERLVLLALADHADEDGSCYPSVARLCARTGMKERGVQTVLKRLREKGQIEVQLGGGRCATSVYRIVQNPASDAPIPVDKPRTRNPVSDDKTPHLTTETPHSTAVNPASDAPEPFLTTIEPSGRVSPHNPPSDLEAEFSVVWANYPRKVGRGAALKAWQKARKRHSREEITTPLGQFIRAVRGADLAHVPHLATWLNQERWDDDQSHARNGPRSSTDDLGHLATISATADLANLFPLPTRRALAS